MKLSEDQKTWFMIVGGLGSLAFFGPWLFLFWIHWMKIACDHFKDVC